jgi:DNA polymerase III epsilon subunit-like protein
MSWSDRHFDQQGLQRQPGDEEGGGMDPVVVTDFEATGLSSEMGDRAIEIAAVLIRDGRIGDRYQCLMNAGRRIPNTSPGSATP